MLCAQALESARILFNSAAPGRRPRQLERRARPLPDGSHLGRRAAPAASSPTCAGAEPRRRPHRPNGIYVHRASATRRTAHAPQGLPARLRLPGRRARRTSTGARPASARPTRRACASPSVTMTSVGFGECLPYEDNFVAIDKGVVDIFGIPVLRISMAWGENENDDDPRHGGQRRRRCWRRRARRTSSPSRSTTACPATASTRWAWRAWATIPKKSVLNQFQQTHDVKNLFVMDAAGVHVRRLPEPDPDHHGPGRPVVRLPDGRDAEGEHLTAALRAVRRPRTPPLGAPHLPPPADDHELLPIDFVDGRGRVARRGQRGPPQLGARLRVKRAQCVVADRGPDEDETARRHHRAPIVSQPLAAIPAPGISPKGPARRWCPR